MNSYTVEFRIEGASLVPIEVTTLLKLSPCQVRANYSEEGSKLKRIPFWSYDGISTEVSFIEADWKTLEEGLDFLLDKLLPKKQLIQNEFTGYRKYLWCGNFQETFNGAIIFSPKLLEKLSEFNIELIINNYFSDSEVTS